MSSIFPTDYIFGLPCPVASGTVGQHEKAEVAELADAGDSKSPGPCALEGSSPSFGTMKNRELAPLRRLPALILLSRLCNSGVIVPEIQPVCWYRC